MYTVSLDDEKWCKDVVDSTVSWDYMTAIRVKREQRANPLCFNGQQLAHMAVNCTKQGSINA